MQRLGDLPSSHKVSDQWGFEWVKFRSGPQVSDDPEIVSSDTALPLSC